MAEPIEFKTEIKENMIKLPDYLKTMNLKNVRVIILKDDRDEALKKKLPEGFYDPLRAPTYRIIGKRDEIYER
jgi:hypothetical protein